MPWQPQQFAWARQLPRVLVEARSDELVTAGFAEHVEVVGVDVWLYADTAYELSGFTRARWLGDVGAEAQAWATIAVDGVHITLDMSRPVATSTARTVSVAPSVPRYVPSTSRMRRVSLLAARTGMPTPLQDLEFRGVGGSSFEHRITVAVVGPA